jgi:hypothetical protein
MMALGSTRSYGGLPPTGGAGRCCRWRRLRQYSCNGVRQLGERADRAIGVKRFRSHLAIAEIDGDHRHIGRPRGAHIGHGIADHNRARNFAAGAADGQPKYLRIRLLHAERVPATDRCEIAAEIQNIEQTPRKPFKLVGANCEAATFAGELLEHVFEVRKRARAVGNMRAIVVDEDPKHTIELGARYVSAFGDQSSLDHVARAAADHAPRIIIGNRRQAFAGEDEIERRNQVGRGIN